MTGASKPVRRIGLLIPSSNTVVEPETMKLIPQDGSVTVHFSRFRVTVISDNPASVGQFEQDAMVEAALLLADAKVERIAWAGTAASWLGPEHDRSLISTITMRSGIPATSAVLAIDMRLRSLGARRIGLVTPYIAQLEKQIVENYGRQGIAIVAARRLDLTVNTDYALVSEDQIQRMVLDVASAKPDAIVIMCTNLRFGIRARQLSSDLGLPIIDSVAQTISACLA